MGSKGRLVGARRDEQVSDCRKDRCEPLQACRRPKALHHPLLLSQREMRILCPVVQALVRPVLNPWHDLASSSSIGGQLVGDDALRCHSLLLHQPGQQALGCFGVAAALNDLIKHVSVLVDSPPEPVFPAGDADNYFIQMPNVSRVWRLAAEAPGILWSELSTPPADRS